MVEEKERKEVIYVKIPRFNELEMKLSDIEDGIIAIQDMLKEIQATMAKKKTSTWIKRLKIIQYHIQKIDASLPVEREEAEELEKKEETAEI